MAKGELYINGADAWVSWGVRMGDGFLDEIDGFAPMKDYISNESRLENGKRVLTSVMKVASRSVTLHFLICGDSEEDYRTKRKAFETELRKGAVAINAPKLGDDVYNLVYTGKSISYGLTTGRCTGEFSAKFDEPDPTNRI